MEKHPVLAIVQICIGVHSYSIFIPFHKIPLGQNTFGMNDKVCLVVNVRLKMLEGLRVVQASMTLCWPKKEKNSRKSAFVKKVFNYF